MDRTSQAAFVGVTGLGPKLVGGSSSDARAASGATNVRKRASTSYIVYPYDGGRLGLPPLAPAGALAASDPAVPGASQLPASDRNLGRTVVISLAVLFATVSLGQLGWLRARVLGDRKHLDPLESPTVLDTSVPRNDTVARVFLMHAPAQVAALGVALEASDAAAIRAGSHKLKGGCLAIGARRMAELCGLLEAGSGDSAPQYAELCLALAEVERELTAQLVDASN